MATPPDKEKSFSYIVTQAPPNPSLASTAEMIRRQDDMEPPSDASATQPVENGRPILPSPSELKKVQSHAQNPSLLKSLGNSITELCGPLIASLYDIGASLSAWAVISAMLDVSILLVMIYATNRCFDAFCTVLDTAELKDMNFVLPYYLAYQEIDHQHWQRAKKDAGIRKDKLHKLELDLVHDCRVLLMGCILWIIRVCGPATLRYTRIFSTKMKHASLGPWLAVTRFLWPELEIKTRKETQVIEEGSG